MNQDRGFRLQLLERSCNCVLGIVQWDLSLALGRQADLFHYRLHNGCVSGNNLMQLLGMVT